ncbi:hypothetical protein D3C83_49510 [compost metagenome]
MPRASSSAPSRNAAEIAYSASRISGVAIGNPRMRLKSVKPLLPPKPVSLRKNSSIAAKVSAWVMIEK